MAISLSDFIGVWRWTNPITFQGKLLQTAFGIEPDLLFVAEQIIRRTATRIVIPLGHTIARSRYAQANPADGRILNNAVAQEPSYFIGGWLLNANSDAEAMTFGNSVFFRSHPDMSTYVHELVHIDQYDRVGRFVYLSTYFGISVPTIVKRVFAGQPLNVMNSNPYEAAAYDLEARFRAWIAKNPNP